MTAIEDCDIFEVSTPELDDVVRLEDRYGGNVDRGADRARFHGRRDGDFFYVPGADSV